MINEKCLPRLIIRKTSRTRCNIPQLGVCVPGSVLLMGSVETPSRSFKQVAVMVEASSARHLHVWLAGGIAGSALTNLTRASDDLNNSIQPVVKPSTQFHTPNLVQPV
ncbi:hypothetical protein J1N35_015688 [Gossypium stocksii]|uniref:Uncharacterized protein n=1 Tax=Gossypium stocksii TaxID=47602 RepID=A0A9D4AB25_9ROSI|nr:hypothetical protein J1N35_015688 [Gossypium stocksii]